MNKKVSIVILNYNGEKFLRQFLPSVIQHSGEADIVVADNASTDGSLTLLRAHFPEVRIIPLDQNYGFCGGYNRALQQVTGTYYALLNSDVEVTAGWLEPLMALLDRHPTVAAVQPKIRSFHHRQQFEYAGAAGGFIDSLGYTFCRGRLFDTIEEDQGQYNDEREVFWASGACFVVRSELFHQSGGFDEDFFAHMEEIDLCWRLKRAGHIIYYTGQSLVYHVGGGTLSKLNPRKTFLNFRNGLYLLVKNLPASELAWKLPVRLALDYLAAMMFTVKGELSHACAVPKAHYFFIKKCSRLAQKRRSITSATVTVMTARYAGLIAWNYYIKRYKKINV